MKITAALRKWIVENCEVKGKADATDDDLREAASKAIVAGKLTAEKLSELSVDPDEKEANEFSKKLDQIADGLSKLAEIQTKAMEGPVEKTETDEEKAAKEKEAKEKADAEEKEKKEQAQKKEGHWYSKMVGEIGSEMIGDDMKSMDIKVKEAADGYQTTKTALIYPDETRRGDKHFLAGQQVKDFDKGRSMDTLSERDKAVSGAWAKYLVLTIKSGGSKTLGWMATPRHEKELILYAMDNMDWGGASDGGDEGDIKGRLTPHQKQALIDDAVSGGLEAAPIVFDDDVIQAPLLYGELFPKVKIVPIERGRRIEAVDIGTVTLAWGGVDDTAIALFNTNAYVTAFNTTIFRTQGAIRIGLDFLSDTPIDFGALVTAQYGERLLEELDDVIATGNGTTQPEGIMNHAAVPALAWLGVTTIGNYEALRFGVAKPEHNGAMKATAVFCGTETSYERAKALPVAAADARRLFAGASTNVGTYDDYAIMSRAYAINESLNNTQIFYAILGRYRMYRRRGLTMRSSTEGDTLVRRNEILITITARFGGQLERAAAAALTTTAPV